MDSLDQLKIELDGAQQKKEFFEEQLRSLAFCINVLKKEVAYRAN